MSDILGVGRVVDEASEVLDSLDRPIVSRTIVTRQGKTTTTDHIGISKLDIAFIVLIGAIIIVAIEYRIRTGRSFAEYILGSMGDMRQRLLGSGTIAKGAGVTGEKSSSGQDDMIWTTIKSVAFPLPGVVGAIKDFAEG